jgi:hypothetical protein
MQLYNNNKFPTYQRMKMTAAICIAISCPNLCVSFYGARANIKPMRLYKHFKMKDNN